MNLTRLQLEAAAERAADAMLRGRLDLAEPLTVIIEALDAAGGDPDFEDCGDLEDGGDIERGCWGSGATPDQYRLTYDVGPDSEPRSFGVLPRDVPGFDRVTTSLPERETRLARTLVRILEGHPPDVSCGEGRRGWG